MLSANEKQLAAFDEHYMRARQSIVRWLRLDARHVLQVLRGAVPPPAKLLEVGCATGEFCVCARELGYEVEGLEMSPSLGEFARREYGLSVLLIAQSKSFHR